MKIDFYISSLSGGGAEKIIAILAKRCAERGDEVSLISLEKRAQFYSVDEKVKLIQFKGLKSGKLRVLLEDYRFIKKYMRRSKSDLSVSFLSRCNLLTLLSAMFTKHKVIVCDRNNILKEHSRLYFFISNIFYSRAEAVVVQTQQIKSFYPKYLLKKIVVIENPLDTVTLEAQLNGFEQRENLIVSMGRLEMQKDFRTLIKAFATVHAIYPDWKLKIFGKGEMGDKLQEDINSRGLTDIVLLSGITKTPLHEMKKAKIFVLSSNYEGFPNVLCEAMFAGDLCISSDCISGPRELIKDGENGWLFQIGNDIQLAELLNHAILKYDSLEAVSSAAQLTVRRLYLENNFEEWAKIFELIVNSSI